MLPAAVNSETDTADTGLWAGAHTCSVPILLQVAGAINGGGVSRASLDSPWETPSRQCDLGPQCSHLGNGPQGPCQAHQTLSHQACPFIQPQTCKEAILQSPSPLTPGSWLPVGNVANLVPPTQGLIFLLKWDQSLPIAFLSPGVLPAPLFFQLWGGGESLVTDWKGRRGNGAGREIHQHHRRSPLLRLTGLKTPAGLESRSLSTSLSCSVSGPLDEVAYFPKLE